MIIIQEQMPKIDILDLILPKLFNLDWQLG